MDTNVGASTHFVRVRDRKLSLWQSAAARTVKERHPKLVRTSQVLGHPMMRAVNTHVQIANNFEQAASTLVGDDRTQVRLSHVAFNHALTLSKSNIPLGAQLKQAFVDAAVPFSDNDYAGWFSCVTTYWSLYFEGDQTLVYNDWEGVGGKNPNYGLIDYVLPAGAKVAIIGDWGTGLDDAKCLLQDIVEKHAPTAIIHLGDIYYSGTPGECTGSFQDIIASVYGQQTPVPVFTIPGNHDYYDWGHGFYQMLPNLNAQSPGTPSTLQEASYFCLRTHDDAWQFLAMDTGYYDSDPDNAVDPWVIGPGLQASEIAWHKNKLEEFRGTTILLSHHQLFSANNEINGVDSQYDYLPYLNVGLFSTFWDYFADKVAMWIWGHEHNFVMYEDELWGLAKGRLVGCSAYEEFVSSEPYGDVYPQVPRIDRKLDTTTVDGQAFYDHGYAIIDFSAAPVTIGYYDYPAFFEGSAPQRASKLICQETIVSRHRGPPTPVASGATINLLGQEALYLGARYTGELATYPTLAPLLGDAVAQVIARIDGLEGSLCDGDTVTIQTTEGPAGGRNCVSSEQIENCCTYGSPDAAGVHWVIRKKSTASGTTINMHDAVYLVSQASSDSGSPSVLRSIVDPGTAIFLTTAGTTSSAIYYWRLMPAGELVS